MTTTERIVEAINKQLLGDEFTADQARLVASMLPDIRTAIASVIGKERPKIDLEESVYYKNLLATSSNLLQVIKDKQWERLDSHVWATQNAIELCKKNNPAPPKDLTPKTDTTDGE